MKKISLIFPGQGSQYLGMGKTIIESSSVAKEVFEEANDALGFDLQTLILEGPTDNLTRSDYAQPAVVTMSIALYQLYKQQYGIVPEYGAGHSLGEISALIAAGAIPFRAGVQFAKKRGELMQQAEIQNKGRMGLVLGVAEETVEQLCEDMRAKGSVVSISGYNSPLQQLVSGDQAALEELGSKIYDADGQFVPFKMIPNKVDAPYHSPLMAFLTKAIRAEIESNEFFPLNWKVVSNVTAQPYGSHHEISTNLSQQLINPVKWRQTISFLKQEGVEIAIEIGPQYVLRDLMKEQKTPIPVFSFDVSEDMEKLNRELAETKNTLKPMILENQEKSFPSEKGVLDSSLSPHEIEQHIEQAIRQETVQLLETPANFDKPDVSFLMMGISSILSVKLVRNLNQALNLNLGIGTLFDHSTREKLKKHITQLILSNRQATPETPAPRPSQPNDVTAAPPIALSTKESFVEIGLSDHQLADYVDSIIKQETVQLLETPANFEKADVSFLMMGITSILSVKLVRNLNQVFNIDLGIGTLFDHSTRNKLKKHIVGLLKAKGRHLTADTEMNPIVTVSAKTKSSVLANETVERDRKAPIPSKEHSANEVRQDNAIIGMAAKFPEANTIDEFWKNLVEQKPVIKEVPLDHWDWRPWFDEDENAPNKTYAKWGGFIEDVDKFDPRFFGISPKEAAWLDPQLRVLLEIIHDTIEDAGYGQTIYGTNTSVYVGASFHEYWDEINRDQTLLEDYQHLSLFMSSLSSRISYTFDFQGGSISFDNACASSLTAVHLACNDLRNGESDMSFVAGTNLILSPLHYVYFSRMSALSPTGECHTFDTSADGYVPSEGVNALLLKPLAKAQSDGDNIHAVIKGVAINHTGRASNPTSPRPEQQAKMIESALKNAKIHPETITYLEAHGTGTKLGDPIEIDALKKAFGLFTKKTHYCAIGSAKAHIGHMEAAAGIGSVIKVILSMKHQLIPVMPNYKEQNPFFTLDNSPFYINTEPKEWQQLEGIPRRAGISSFGMTGNNAHLILEEYPKTQIPMASSQPQLFLLSATSQERLKAYSKKMLDFLDERQLGVAPDFINLEDIIYTLQIGRKHFAERVAIVVSSLDDLKSKLHQYFEGKSSIDGLVAGNIKSNREGFAFDSDEGRQFIDSLIVNRKLSKVAWFWINGFEIDWEVLHRNSGARRVSLPTYPFERVRCWRTESNAVVTTTEDTNVVKKLHPLIGENVSDFFEQKFINQFQGSEFYLTDHVIRQHKMLPGVAYIEMGRVTGEIALKNEFRK